MFKRHSDYMRYALVWGAQGIYSKYEYLERIFFDAILHEDNTASSNTVDNKTSDKHEKIGNYNVKNYVEQPHEYKK